MNEERLIKTVKDLISQGYVDEEDDTIGIFIKLLNLIQTQSKQIDLMATKIYEEGVIWDNLEEVKSYFKKKASEEE